MGLLSRISAGIDIPVEQSSSNESLLDTSVNMETGKLSFFEFLNKNSLSHCAVFSRADSFYSFCFSWGFGGPTVLQSISTADFWEGSTQTGEWTTFSSENNNLNTILQFFPDSQKKNFTSASIFNAGNNLLFIAEEKGVLSETELNSFSDDFRNIDFTRTDFYNSLSEKTNKISFSIDISKVLLESSGNLNPVLKSQIIKALYSECVSILTDLSNDNISVISSGEPDYKIGLSVSSEAKISQNSIQSFFTEELKKVFGTKANLISYEY